jgi:hypothetical protein
MAKKTGVTNEMIVAAYMEAYAAKQPLTAVTTKLGMKYNALYARVKALREPKTSEKTGRKRDVVNLPDLVEGQRGVQTKVASLNAMIEAALAVTTEEKVETPATE